MSRLGLAAPTVALFNRTAFQPFTQKDENDLVQVIKTKPRHVLKHVRQQVWRSRKRELYFRNTVTHLMIILQEFLRKKMIEPAYASDIMDGVLEECVTYAQHDMAHLLFRALLRFRKYGCTISVNSIRYLFESYKNNDTADLMLQLANEMKEDPALRPLCMAAYLFAGHEAEADALREGIALSDLSKDSLLALVAGYEKLRNNQKLLELMEQSRANSKLSAESKSELYSAFLHTFFKLDDDAGFTKTLVAAVEDKVQLEPSAFSTILRHKMRHVTSAEEIAAIEEELKGMGYVPDVGGSSIIITAYARLLHFGDRGSEELMLSKVDTLLSSIESRLKQGDPDMDISAAHIRAVIRGYGAAGRPDAIKEAWSRMQYAGLTNDVRVYNELFKWLSLMGNVKDVLSLKEEMEAKNVSPDSTTYTWILRALGKFYPRHVEEMYQEVMQRNIRADVQLFNTLVGIFGDLGQLDNVDALIAEMLKREEAGTLQFTPVTFAILIRVHARDPAKAKSFYDAARRRNVSDHPHVRTSMLHVLASQRDDRRDGDASHKAALEDFLSSLPNWDTDVYNVLLNMYGKQKNKEQFDKTLEKMKKEEVPMNDVTFGTLITAFARWGEVEKVNSVIQLLKAHEGEVSATFYSVLASSLNRMGNAEGVSNAWDDLLASKLFPDTEVYNQFLTLYSRQHDMKKMQGVLDNMMKQIPPNPVTATTVLDMLGKAGRVAEMEALFADMKTSPDTLPTSVTYHQMMNAYAKGGDVAKMERIHEEFVAKGYRSNAVTYNILADGYGRAKRFEQMEELLKKRVETDGIPFDEFTYCIVITAYGKARMQKEVHRILAEVEGRVGSGGDAPVTRRVLWSLIDALCRCGDTAGMQRVIELMKAQTASGGSGEGGGLGTRDTLALIPYYCRMGQMESAENLLDTLSKTEGFETPYSTLNAIARGYSKVGRFDKTVECLHQMREKNWVPDAATALQLSGAFIKAGLHEQAKQIIEWRRQYAKIAGEEASE